MFNAGLVIGVVIAIGFSCFLNLLVVIGMLKKSTPLSLRDILLVSLSVADFCQTGLGYTTELYGHLSDDYSPIFLCRASGFAVTFTALVAITHLMALAVERYLSLVHALKAHEFFSEPKRALYFIIPAWIWGLFWSGAPLLKWGGYEREPHAPHRCSVVLAEKTPDVLSYSYGLLIACFAFPVLVITWCCFRVQRELKGMTDRSKEIAGQESAITAATQKAEKQHFIMICCVVIAFFIAWTPYAGCVVYFTLVGNLPANLMSTSAFFAKFSVLANPIIYAIFYKDFRRSVKAMLCGDSAVAPSE
uniref:Opsin n=1 Tax=Cladonema radiatum TaxID=264074 RepID=A9CR54_9CNID|nr:opsin [Cladonema radiatum]